MLNYILIFFTVYAFWIIKCNKVASDEEMSVRRYEIIVETTWIDHDVTITARRYNVEQRHVFAGVTA